MKRYYYGASIDDFLNSAKSGILGELVAASTLTGGSLDSTQSNAWQKQVEVLQSALGAFRGKGSVYFEYSIPRLGKRIDVVVVIGPAVFVIEFKVGADRFHEAALDQVWDYALDLKNFHEPSHQQAVIPVLVPTAVVRTPVRAAIRRDKDGLFVPIGSTIAELSDLISDVLGVVEGGDLDADFWAKGRYSPTPTIIEAAVALYGGHSVAEISRSDAGATNLTHTSESVLRIIRESREKSQKAICFVTGVPGAGKTLVGLDVATRHSRNPSDVNGVFLSGNGPLVKILQEALAMDKVRQQKELGEKPKIGEMRRKVKVIVQNVHHFRDACLVDRGRPPVDHVAIFDEAQRAWDLKQTSTFMQTKKGQDNFNQSEPEFLISCLDRHEDWAVIVCLVGGGQEINTGEIGIVGWLDALLKDFPGWKIYMSSRLQDAEYGAGRAIQMVAGREGVVVDDGLHLGVSMRSYRAENVSRWVKELLDLRRDTAASTLQEIGSKYPIVLTRDLVAAKKWVREKSRGTERFGLIASSEAQRLKPHAIDVRAEIDPVHWFLHEKTDVRSSYYLEGVATEFQVQGLELDWTCLVWDGDFRYSSAGWVHRCFRGSKWQRIDNREQQQYQKNAYRVLLTRARQGMVIVVPEGDPSDPTRQPGFYDSTYEYLASVGIPVL